MVHARTIEESWRGLATKYPGWPSTRGEIIQMESTVEGWFERRWVCRLAPFGGHEGKDPWGELL